MQQKRDFSEMVDVLAAAVGIAMEDTWRAGVAAHFEAIAKAAQEVEAVPLEERAEPAWHYEA